jgi:hypothetical protein
MKYTSCLTLGAAALLLAALAARAEVKVTVGHNGNDQATPAFKFDTGLAVSATDAATAAKFTLVDGTADDSSGDLGKLHDGKLPAEDDAPGDNFFFQAGTTGGRLRVDLGGAISVKQVNTFSWHPNTRGPQVYKLYASDGSAAGFNASPKKGTDPESCGWKLIASVNTKSSDDDNNGGQYGVSITDSTGPIGSYRFLLFDIGVTENEDGFGNTFYSEIDVLDASAPAASPAGGEAAEAVPSYVFKTADGKCEITVHEAEAPRLKDWVQTQLAPALAEWYPKIAAMLPSEGYSAPTNFSITLKPVDGVAFTSGRRVVANSDWLESEIGKEAVGSLVHEAVHVVQHFGGNATHNPGWLVEGTADYIRWFKYEPQSHGADLVWLRQQRHFTPRYNDSYRVTANFLNWVSEKYDAKIVGQMNAAMRDGKYDDGLWRQYTGKSAPELGAEWQREITAQLAK